MAGKYIKKKSRHDRAGKRIDIAAPSHPARPEEKEGWGSAWYVLFALVMVITLASYSNSLHNEFVFDDSLVILDNPTIRGIEKIPRLLGLGQWNTSYRPVRMISYAVDYTLNEKLWQHVGSYTGRDKGLNPLGYHIANCTYHLLTVLLVFLVVSRLGANKRIAFLAAALFALHPVHTDSVTYLSGRRDILAALFYLAGFYFFLRYRQTPKVTFMLGAFFSYLLSMGSKEMGVTLPALFLCYDVITRAPGKARRINAAYVKELFFIVKKVLVQSRYLYAPLCAGSLLFAYYKVFMKSPSFRTAYYGDSMLTTFLTVGKILVYYMQLLVYPINLNADYSYNAFPLSASFLEPATLVSFAVLGIVGYAVLRLIVTHRILAFGVIWFFITLLPVCHIVPHHELMAEHYLYLPSFGFCLVVAYLLNRFLEGKRYRYYIYALCTAAALLFSIRIVDRNRDWKDDLTLWQKTVETAPRCARAHSNLGLAYYDRALYDKAISQYKEALAIGPNYAQAHFNLGLAYDRKGMLKEATTEYEKTISLLPRFAKAYNNLAWIYVTAQDETVRNGSRALLLATRACELTDFKNAKYLDTLATASADQGKGDAAIAYQLKALTRAPLDEKGRFIERLQRYPNVHSAFKNFKVLTLQNDCAGFDSDGMFLDYEQGAMDKAIAACEKAVEDKPGCAANHHNLGVAYLRRFKFEETTAQFIAALTINPRSEETCVGMGVLSIYQGAFELAIAFFKRALELNPDLAEAHHNLASAYYLQGDYKAALYHCDQADDRGQKVSPALLELLNPYR